MICPNCKKENMNEYATVCAYCGQELYQGVNAEEKAKELSAKQKKDKRNSIIITAVSVLLAVVVVVVALIIPKPEKDDATTTTLGSSESTTVSDLTDNLTDKNDSVVNDNTDSSGNTETTTNKVTTSNGMETTEEILAYFNTNANRVKTEATKVVKNYEDREINEIVAPKALQSTAESMVKTFMADDTDPVEYTTREEIVENFQVPKQSYVSRLKVDDIQKATCKDMGSYYEITITVKSEDNPTAGSGVGAAFDVIETEEVESGSDIVEDFSTHYKNCTVVANFDKSTNRMTHAKYMISTKLMVTIKAFGGLHEASIDMSFEKDYTITY